DNVGFQSGKRQVKFADFMDIRRDDLPGSMFSQPPKSKDPSNQFTAKDVAERFTAVDDYKSQRPELQYLGAFPNFHEGANNVYGTFFLTRDAGEWRSIPIGQLQDPSSSWEPE